MNSLPQILSALGQLNVAACFAGALMGFVAGLVPALGPAAAVAVVLPFTFLMPPAVGLSVLTAVAYGSHLGRTSTLAAQSGESRFALAFASAAASGIVVILIALLIPVLAQLGSEFGPAEYTAFIVATILLAV